MRLPVRLLERREPQHLQHRISTMTSNIVTITVVIAPTIVIITPAMADITAIIPPPIAENIEPMMNKRYVPQMSWIGSLVSYLIYALG